MDEDWLKKILDDDDLGLLKVKPKNSVPTADQHLINKFNELVEFVDTFKREPEANMANVSEFMLHKRLMSIRSNADQCAALEELDKHGLLPKHLKAAEPSAEYQVAQKKPQKEIKSLEDIFSDDDLGILHGDSSIFDLKHVPKERTVLEHVSRRKRCKDFAQFKPVFDAHHAALKTGTMKTIRFQSELQIKKGEVFVVDGMLAYVANVGTKEKKNFGNVNARLYVVFDNGTESNIYLRSLAAALWKDPTSGHIVDSNQPDLIDEHFNVTDDDQASGYIYILQSLSDNPEIKNVNNLFKIGYSTTPVEKRIANAPKEPTYLMAPVKTVSVYQCYNMNTQKFENLIHTFFGNACLDVEIADLEGKTCKPREWFIAPLASIELAIKLLINGEIVHYRYDTNSGEVRLRGENDGDGD